MSHEHGGVLSRGEGARAGRRREGPDGERSRADRVYVLSGDGFLCFECATAREGVYEELLDRWTVTPRIDDLRPELR